MLPDRSSSTGGGDGGGGPSIEMLEKARRARDFDGLPKLEQEKALRFFKKQRLMPKTCRSGWAALSRIAPWHVHEPGKK